ncbi:hypothetical protein EVA_19929 [gut metagenome]|uniref:Wadjet protein JetD C-terminal domain-containing protein n=1 Tax=gut metagenome TaxID=749906 RepID=J9BWM4_9ZZZZ
MISPSEIKNKAEKIYLKYLRNIAAGIPFEKIVIPCDKKPSKDFEKYRKEHDELHASSREIRGYGYSVTWENVNHKTLGRQALPREIAFITESDLLKFVRKEKEVQQFKKDLIEILTAFPLLSDWAKKYPLKVVDHAGEWSDLLKVLSYFSQHPQPNLYIRELPVEVHTKFIEQHKGILRELLDLLIADYVLESEQRFETHFHLKYDEELIRIRFLDERLCKTYGCGIKDISLPVSEFCDLNWNVKAVFIVENKVNFLTFPPIADAIIIWGHGYGIASLKKAKFLQHAPLYYWGDLDAQGFEILSQFRGYFPQTQSILMDRSTFDVILKEDQARKVKWQ